MEKLKGIKEVKNNNQIGEKKMEKLTLELKKDVTKGEKKMEKIKILKYDVKDISMKKELVLNSKIKYAMLFKHAKEIIDGEEIVVYYPEIVLAESILRDIENPALKRVKEQNEKELREFLNELPKVEDIVRKPVLKEIYDTAEFGIKILTKDIGYSEDDLYNIKYSNKIFKVTKGELITFGIWKEMNRNKYIPSLGLGPEKVIYFHKTDKLREILSIRNLLEEFNKMESPQKQFQRLHKILSPLTDLSAARVYVGDIEEERRTKVSITNKLLGIDTTFTEGVLLVSQSYAKENNLVEGAKLSYTLKSLIHIVPDDVLVINGKQYDVVLSADENKWKVEAEKLGNILKAFTGKTPDINAKVCKIIQFKPNNMFFTRMSNRLTYGLKEKLAILKELAKYSCNVDKLLTKEGNEFEPEFEKFLFDLLSIKIFDKNKEIDNNEEGEVNTTLLVNEVGQEILNMKYIYNTDYIDTDGIQKHTDSTWIIHPTESKPVFNRTYFERIGKSFANMLFNRMICADFVGCSGTVLPMSMKASDAYPIAFDVTMYKNEYTKERLAKMEKLGIAPNMMYVQRHPSMLGVWTELLYSPSTKLFYVDEELWKTFFGGDFDGDNFVGLYPFHPKNAKMNNLLRKIVDPIDNDRMTALIDKGEVREFLTKGIFDIINKLENKYTAVRRDIMLLALDKVNPNFTEVVKGKKNPLFKKHPEFANWAKVYDKQQIVGKIHAIVCNALSFFVKNLTVMDELKFSTYFILKHIQPAIEGLKQKEEGFIPDTKSLIAEMMFVYEEMFGTAKFKNLHIPKLEDIVKHKQIYSKIRGFETIGLVNKYTGEYDYNDLYYKKDEYKEIAERIKTSWTELYLRVIKFAEKYFKDTDLEPTTPTPTKKTDKLQISMTPVIPVKNTFENIKKEVLKEEVMKNTMTLVSSSVPEQKTEVINKKEENTMEKRVFFSGSHTLKMLPQQAKKVLKLAKEKNVTVLVGDCNGADKLVQQELIGYKNVVVYSMYQNPRNNLGNWTVKTIPNSYAEKVDYATWQQQKDIAMSKDCTSAVALWDGNSNGTRANKDRVLAMKKKVLLITAPNGEPMPFLQTYITPRKYAGIGDVNIPENIKNLIHMLAEELAKDGYILRTGGAKGADTAFIEGCDKAKGIKEVFYPSDLHVNAKTLKIAKEIHGHWEYCENKLPKPGNKYSFPVQAHCRNMKIINGDVLNNPVEFTIAYQDINQVTGGTWQGIKYSQKLGIKVYNLFVEKDRNEIIDIVFGWDVEQKEKALKLFNIVTSTH